MEDETIKLRMVIVALIGFVFGILLLLLPYYFKSDSLVISISSVLGSFMLPYGVVRPIHNHFLWKNQLRETQTVLEKSLTVFQDKIVGLDHGVGHPVLSGLLTVSERGSARP